MSSKNIKRWITINGNHVPVYEDGTLGGIAEKFTSYDGEEHEIHAEKATGKTVSDLKDDLKKNYGLEIDSADAHDMQNSRSFNDEKVTMYDKDGNEYEGTYNKYSDGGREIVDIKKKEDNSSSEAAQREADNEEQKREQGFDSITPSNGDDLKSMDNAGKMLDAMDKTPVGDTIITTSDEYGTMGYKKVGDDKYQEVASGLYAEGWSATNKNQNMNSEDVSEKLLDHVDNGGSIKVKEQSAENQAGGDKIKGDGTYDISKKTNEPKTSFGQEFQGKADQYREKFLTNKSDEEIANIKANLDKSTAIVGTTEGDHVAYKAIEDEMSRRKNRSSSSAPSKESARITKGVELARKQLDFDKPGEYAEISDRHWGKTLGVSNERMAEMMSVQDPKYDYEYKKDTETRKAFGSNVTVEHHRMYRVPKESTRETATTKSPMARAHSMSESELRAYVRSHGLTKQYNMMINNKANASHSNIMSVLRDLVADEIAVEEARKRKKK